MASLVESLRVTREQGDSKIVEHFAVSENTDLQPLAEEIKSLIDGQRQSARQVKVKQQYLEVTQLGTQWLQRWRIDFVLLCSGLML